MLKAIASAGWLFITKKERAVGIRAGETTAAVLNLGESCWRRPGVEILPGVSTFLLLTFSWDRG
jgi:hypothetical protein